MRYKKVRFFGCLLSLQEKWLNRMSQQGYHLINTSRLSMSLKHALRGNINIRLIILVTGVVKAQTSMLNFFKA